MIATSAYWVVLAATVPIFWLLPMRARPAFLALASFAFLATLDAGAVLSLLAFALAFRLFAPLAARPGRGFIVVALVVAIVGYLAWFKYLPPALAALRGERPPVILLLPLGISYATFKMIHYALETARGNLPRSSLGDFLCYAFLFPIFSAGPIERYDHFLVNQAPRPDAQLAAEGLTRIAHGLIKKFVLVGIVIQALAPDHGSAVDVRRLLAELPDRSVVQVWSFCALSFLVMYLDFSAYSDIAIGASLLFGIRIMENFDWPILASDISAFWSRWHMTLTGWCQSYVFMPVLGLTRRLPVAVFAGFVAIGLWHAGSWSWVSWGLYHATGVSLFHAWQSFRERRGRRGPAARPGPLRRVAGTLLTLAFVTGSFAILAGDSAGGARDGLRILAKLAGIDVGRQAQRP